MIDTWFNTDERLQALTAEAFSWEGTPFFINGDSKGRDGGAACHKMIAQIPMTLGALPPRKIPNYHPSIANQLRISRMGNKLKELWPDRIAEVNKGDPTFPGDLVSFKAHVGEWHMAIRIPDVNGQQLCILHMVPSYGASISNLYDMTYDERMMHAWRILP